MPAALIREAVLAEVSGSRKKLTPRELEKRLSQKLSSSLNVISMVIKNLINENELTYTYHYGCSFIEMSFNKPTRISDRIVLKPPNTVYRTEANQFVIDILSGASFGSGEHPSTRLAIQGIDWLFSRDDFFGGQTDLRALDIGTGSGVLAMVAALLGMRQVVGIDIDACARAEAKENVRLNNLEKRIHISDRKIEDMDDGLFSLITANLRYPTLMGLSRRLSEITVKKSAVILSGLKSAEVSALIHGYSRYFFRCIWKTDDKDWTCLVFERRTPEDWHQRNGSD